VDAEDPSPPPKKWQFWKKKKGAPPAKFGWIMGVLVSGGVGTFVMAFTHGQGVDMIYGLSC
jgi:hypothetical protein